MKDIELGEYSQARPLFLMNDSWNKMSITDDVSSTAPHNTFFESEDSKIAQFAMTASWIINWLLLFAKIICLVLSNSLVVAASLADSAVDLLSQAILSLAERYMGKHNPDYPVGRSRLEALSVLAAASIMSMASVEVIQYSAIDIANGVQGDPPDVSAGVTVITILSLCIFFKIALYIYCKWAQKILESDLLEALAEDHINDVFSNSAAIVTLLIAANVSYLWWFDPSGAILISLVIIYRWMGIIWEQVKKIVGHTAPPEFIQQVETLAQEHDPRLSVDCVRAYHSGARYNVEMEVVLPGSMTVIESHDVALALQHKIEGLSDVERAFVHVDHQGRDGLEHKIERQLVRKVTSPAAVHSPGRGNSPGNSQSEYPTSPSSPANVLSESTIFSDMILIPTSAFRLGSNNRDNTNNTATNSSRRGPANHSSRFRRTDNQNTYMSASGLDQDENQPSVINEDLKGSYEDSASSKFIKSID